MWDNIEGVNTRKIIVLTPVRNEAWILDRFLQVCSIFADHILIADQNSTDGSLDFYAKYPKVTLVNNANPEYDEASRQLLLLDTAREKFGLGNILLAIDADEILAANAMESDDWQAMLTARPGTVLFFEKPTFFKTTATVIRYDGGGWPLGYIDDGAIHTPSPIHSTRIPTPEYAERLYLNQVKFLHYALVRLDAQAAKQRMYSMLENIKGTKGLRHRRRVYNSKSDFSDEGDRHENSDPIWFSGWERQNIDMHNICTSEYYWYDNEGLKLLKDYGEEKFAYDDIWNFDWEGFRQKIMLENPDNAPQRPIKVPSPAIHQIVGKILQIVDKGFIVTKKIKAKAGY